MKGWLWYAPTAASRPMVAHVLSPDGQVKACIGQFAVSACGTTRARTWQRLGDLTDPAAFRRCPRCAGYADEEPSGELR